MENNLKYIKKFPKKLKKINYYLTNFDNKEDINFNKFIVINELDLMYYQENNTIKIYNYLFDLKYILKTNDEDEITHFGYNYFVNSCYIYFIGISNKCSIIYVYNTENFILEKKILLEDLIGNFYIDFINNDILFSQIDNTHFITQKFNKDFEKKSIIKFELKSDKVIFSFTNNFTYIFNQEILYILNKNNQLISKEETICRGIETFNKDNYQFTIIISEDVIIYDSNNIIRQKIESKNVDFVYFSNSYLILGSYKESKIDIYALDNNGIFIHFGCSKVKNFTNILFINNRIILIYDNHNIKYFDLPTRFFDKNNLIGYGFYSPLNYINSVKNCIPIFLKNGNLSTKLNKNDLFLGFTENVSDLLFNDKINSFEYKFQDEYKNLANLNSNFLLINDDNVNELCKTSSNFIFIEHPNINLVLESDIGSLLKIKFDKDTKLISFSKKYLIITILNNTSLIEIDTKSNIKLLGYTNIKYNFEYNIKTLTTENNIEINNQFLSNYRTFFPYMNNDLIEAITENKLTNIDINFKFNNLNNDLLYYNKNSNIKIPESYNFFSKRYLINYNEEKIIIYDLFVENTKYVYNIEKKLSVKKVIYVNPYLIILFKNEDESKINLININNSNNLPYVISNSKNEKLTDIFLYNKNRMFFVTEANENMILYLVTLDEINEVNNINKISFPHKVKSIKIYEDILVVFLDCNEVIIFDINNNKSLLSIKDNNIIDFSLYSNYFVITIREENNVQLYIYKILPQFEIILKHNLNISDDVFLDIYSGYIIYYTDKMIYVNTFDEINGILKVKEIKEKFIHFYKNLLVTENDYKDNYNIYQFTPKIIYLEKMINLFVNYDEIYLTNKLEDKSADVNLFMLTTKKSQLNINNNIINIHNNKSNNSVINLELKIKPKEKIVIKSLDMSTKLCGIIEDKIYDNLPCFFPDSCVKTINGIIFIKDIKEGDIIINELEEHVKVLKVYNWETKNFTVNNIPYIIPKNSLENNYPNKDTYISPFHKIRLPNGDFKMSKNIKLPFIEQFKIKNNVLKLGNIILESICYYNLILEKNSNFIVNNMIVESLDSNNIRITKE